MRISLDRKKIAGLLIALAFTAFFIYRQSQPPIASASVKIRIKTQFSPAGESLLETQAKGITHPAVMEELIKRLGRSRPRAEENQKEILSILDHLKITRQGNTEIFKIEAFHEDPRTAKDTAFLIAQIFKDQELVQAKKTAEASIALLEKELDQARSQIDTAELHFRRVLRENTPSDIDRQLVQRLQDYQAQQDRLSAMYKETHPEIIDLQKRIDSTKEQIMDGPPLDQEAVKEAENQLRQSDQRYRDLAQKLEDAKLQASSVTGNVQIIEFFSSTRPDLNTKEALQPVHYAGIALALALSIALRIHFRRRF